MGKYKIEDFSIMMNWSLNLARRGVTVIIFSLVVFTRISNAQEDPPLIPGSYRLEMILASITHIPFFGSSKSASKSVSLVEIRKDGTELIQSHQVCDFRVLEDSAMIRMVFPDKFIAALAKHSYPIRIG